jgi:NB-ARC domain.
VTAASGDAKPWLFISYRRTRTAQVEPMVRALEAAGIACFFDQDAIDPLADFPERICKGIGASHGLLAWWSADYTASDHCMAEFRLAWQHARRQSSDVGRRVWVLNPEASADHIAAGELASQNFLTPPADGAIDTWVEPLRTRLRALLPEGPLASERQVAATPKLRNVPRPTATFTGRNAELMRIHSKLHPPRIGAAGAAVAVQTHGLGGIGKTELAAKYAQDFIHAYPGGVSWLNFAGFAPDGPPSETDAHNAWLNALQQTFAGEPELLLDTEGKPLPAPVLRVALERRLGTAPYLWVLDNVPELSPLDRRAAVLEFWRAPGAAGRTLVTTRDSRPAEGFAEERLDVLSEDDALRLLARFRPPREDERDAARELIADVGAHTLALTLIGEQLREAPGGYKGALAKLRETGRLDRIEAFARALQPTLGEKARGILATFEVSITALDKDARELLSAAAVCAPNEPIPLPLLAAVVPDEDGFATALSRLLRASLLTRRRGREQAGEPVEIHPLVADAAVRLLEASAAALAEVLGQRLVPLVDTAGDILTHDQALADALGQARHFAPNLQSQTGVGLSLWIGRYHSARGLYPLARVAHEQALALARRLLGERHPDSLTCMGSLAETLRIEGDLAGARALQENVLAAHRELLGDGHPRTLTSLHNLAVILSNQGNPAGARALKEQVLEISREVLGDRHPDTLASMHNLAATLADQGDVAGARALEERVLAVYCECLGEQHPHTLTSMNNLAEFLFRQGDVAGARALERQVLASRRTLLGERHPDTVRSMNNLAGTLADQGDLAGARALQERALELRREVLGDRHPDTLQSISNLALTLRAQRDVAGALALQEHVLGEYCEVLGDRHPDTLGAMNSLAGTLADQGDLAGARALQSRALERYCEVLGDRHPDTTLSAWNLFMILVQLRAAEKAARVRDDHLAWLLDATAESLDIQQREIRDFLRLRDRLLGRADADSQRSWLSRIGAWLRRRRRP